MPKGRAGWGRLEDKRALGQFLDPDNAESAQPVVVMLADRDIFAGYEPMVAEPVARLVVIDIALNVVMKRPVTAGLPYQMAGFLLIAPEAAGAALGAVLFPLFGIEMPVLADRRDKFIAMGVAAQRKFGIAGKFEPDFS